MSVEPRPIVPPVFDLRPLLVAEPERAPILRQEEFAYGRPLANHALNGYARVAGAAMGRVRVVANLTAGDWETPDRVIVVGSDALVVGTSDLMLWQVSLQRGLTYAFPYRNPGFQFGNYTLRLNPGGSDYVIAFLYTAPVSVSSPSSAVEEQSWVRQGWPQTFMYTSHVWSSQLASFPVDRCVVTVMTWSDPRRGSDSILVRCDPNGLGETTLEWGVGFGGAGYQSPALSDDTLVIHKERGLALVETSEGKIVQEIAFVLMPDRLSTDHADRIWGIHTFEGRLHLVGIQRTGAPFFYEKLPSNDPPTQPPICFPDRRVCLVSALRVSCFGPEGLQWTHPLPEGDEPLATATADGHLFVKVGNQILRIDEYGRELWRATTPDAALITTNIAVTEDGTVCFASAEHVYCMERPDEAQGGP